MARMPRTTFPGLPHHIIQRGNNRSAIFFDESDYNAYLCWLGESIRLFCWQKKPGKSCRAKTLFMKERGGDQLMNRPPLTGMLAPVM